MKTRNRLPFALIPFLVLPVTAPAAVLTWDITASDSLVTGGAGDWNTINTNWTADAGATNVTWPAASSGDDDAAFGGTGGAVNVDAAGITANDITFGVAGYTLGGGGILLDGATNVLTATPNSNNAATISSALSGTAGFTKAGPGTLTVSGANTGLSGTVTVSNATGTNNAGLIFNGSESTGALTSFNVLGSAAPTADGGWIGLANGATIGSDAVVNLSGQGGNSAPPGTLRTTAGTGTVDGDVNLLTGNVRISCFGGAGSALVVNGRISDGGSNFGVLFRYADGNGVHLTNTGNSWTGDTVLGQGTLRIEPGALPATSKVAIATSGNAWLQTYGTLDRPLGTASGSGAIDMGTNAANRVAGISARNGDLEVNFGGAGADLVWGATPGFNPAIFGLNSSTADSMITLVNPIDLNGAARVIQVEARTAILQGTFKNSSATAAGLRKTGAGALEHDPGTSYTAALTGLNTGGGTLRLASGSYTLSGSAATGQPDSANGFIVSRGGTFHLDGANVTCTGGSYVFPAGNTGGGSSNFILDSGTFDGGTREALNAYGATGTTTINGGLFICGEFRISQSATGTVNLNGGTLRTVRLKHSNNVEIVNLNGGTLQAKSSVADFITASVDAVNIREGGVVIDSNGFNIGIPKVLTEDTGSPGGGIVKKGSGILDLAASNTHTGDNLIQGGVLRVSDTAQLGAPSATVVVDGGQFGVSGTAIPSVSALGRTFTYYQGGFHVADAAHTFNADINLTGSGGLSKSGAGTLVLTGTNDFTGNIAGGAGDTGWIEVDAATDLGSGPKTADFTASSQSGVGGIRLTGGVTVSDVTLNIAGRNVNAATQHVLLNLSGDNAWAGDINIANTGGTYYLRSESGRLTLSGNLGNVLPAADTIDVRSYNLEGPGDFTIPGTIRDGLANNRSVGLVIDSTGATVLSGTNTYQGSTVVNGGTLRINGDQSAATGPITVNGTAVLGGTGVLGGALNLTANAVLAPGATVGTLTTTANVGGAGKLVIDIDGASSDRLVLTGTGVIDISTLQLELATLAGGVTQKAHVIVDSNAPITGAAFASVTGLPEGYTLVYGYNDGTDSNNIALVSASGDPFSTWIAASGLSGADAAPSADPDGDGMTNAVEFVVGGQPNPALPGAASLALAPTVANDAGNVVFTFRRTDVAAGQPGIGIGAEYGSTLGSWTPAVDGVAGVTVKSTDDFFGTGIDRVVVTIPANAASQARLFARLKVSLP